MRRCKRRIGVWVFLLWCSALLAGTAAEVPARYAIDQHFGSIEFSVSTFGLFSSRGGFQRFSGTLSLDFAQPQQTQIAVVVDADSISMPWEAATQRLHSPAYFDVAHYKEIRFNSSHVVPVGPHQYRIDGVMEIRGVTRPQTFEARLVRLRPGTAPDTTVADFVVTGEVRRSDFGMTADQPLISNRVHVMIHARITLRGTYEPG